jgi:hypothetical protein
MAWNLVKTQRSFQILFFIPTCHGIITSVTDKRWLALQLSLSLRRVILYSSRDYLMVVQSDDLVAFQRTGMLIVDRYEEWQGKTRSALLLETIISSANF